MRFEHAASCDWVKPVQPRPVRIGHAQGLGPVGPRGWAGAAACDGAGGCVTATTTAASLPWPGKNQREFLVGPSLVVGSERRDSGRLEAETVSAGQEVAGRRSPHQDNQSERSTGRPGYCLV